MHLTGLEDLMEDMGECILVLQASGFSAAF
jgi:hypothetical protein